MSPMSQSLLTEHSISTQLCGFVCSGQGQNETDKQQAVGASHLKKKAPRVKILPVFFSGIYSFEESMWAALQKCQNSKNMGYFLLGITFIVIYKHVTGIIYLEHHKCHDQLHKQIFNLVAFLPLQVCTRFYLFL